MQHIKNNLTTLTHYYCLVKQRHYHNQTCLIIIMDMLIPISVNTGASKFYVNHCHFQTDLFVRKSHRELLFGFPSRNRNWNHTLDLILYEFNNKWDARSSIVCSVTMRKKALLDFFVADKEVPTYNSEQDWCACMIVSARCERRGNN